MHRRALLRALGVASIGAACGPLRATDGQVEPTTGIRPVAPASSAPPTAAPPETPQAAGPTTEPSAVVDEPGPAPTEPAPPDAAAGLVVAVLCRDAWGARPPAGEYRPHTVQRLTVHHSATVLDDNTRAPGRLRQHQQFHQSSGWPDIAYHHGVDRRGNVYELRPTSAAGDTFTDYDPAGHYLILAEGDFDRERPTDEQLESIAAMIAWGSATFGVGIDTVSGHRDHASTACPGARLYGQLDNLRARAIELGAVSSRSDCGDEGRARVAAIERGEA